MLYGSRACSELYAAAAPVLRQHHRCSYCSDEPTNKWSTGIHPSNVSRQVHEWTLVVDCSFSSTPTLVGDLATGVIADYQFNSGTGTILVDNSGNGNNGTFGSGANAPAWVQGGVGFTGQTSEGISLPAAVNAAKTFVIAAYWSPITTIPCGINWLVLVNAHLSEL